MNRCVRIALLGSILVLAGCVAPRARRDVNLDADASQLAAQAVRERTLAARTDWSLRGRLGVSDGRDAGSGTLEWTCHGANYRFRVHAPVTGKTWELAGDGEHVVLSGLRDTPVEAGDAAELLARELGWQVPVAQLSAWVRGMRAPGKARIGFDDQGRPAVLLQDGWRVDYLAYEGDHDPPLPTRLFASRGDYKVRLAIREWEHP